MHLDARHFSDFFTAVHDRCPFPWQQRLASDLAESDEWPEVLDLPTGVGKTAALDVAVFHLALRADDPGRAALRIALVVDRRLVVDDAYAHAQKICKALEKPNLVEDLRRRNVLAEVAKRLAKLAERSARPLIAERLRGGAPLENEWTRTPTQPTILCSTVDQVGSRLLFRGYGVSHRMRPIHAGLLGQNTLILIDEAHIAQPFRQTVSAIRASGGAKVKVALLSATVGHDSQRVFRLSQEDRDNQTLRRRLEADKLARLEKVRPKDDPATVLAARAAEMMTRLWESGVEPAIVGVVVNRVQLARETFERLSAHEEFEALLMIGRCRTIERDRLVQEKLAPFKTGARGRSSAPSMVLVATQCIEVGVDLDVDGLVTQAAPLDSLRQRFGRLNRDGRSIRAEAQVVAVPDDLARSKVDSVYGDRIRATWDALEGIAEDKVVNFGIEALNEHLASMDVDALSSPRTSAPVLMPAYLDLWAQTSPVPAADPAVDLFLHGKQPPAPEVSLVWRGGYLSRRSFGRERRRDGGTSFIGSSAGERDGSSAPLGRSTALEPGLPRLGGHRGCVQRDSAGRRVARVRERLRSRFDGPVETTPEQGRSGNRPFVPGTSWFCLRRRVGATRLVGVLAASRSSRTWRTRPPGRSAWTGWWSVLVEMSFVNRRIGSV